MEEKLYTMQLTKDQVEWLITQEEIKEKLDEYDRELHEYKVLYEKTREDWLRIFKIVGFDVPKGNRVYDITQFWELLEQKFSKEEGE